MDNIFKIPAENIEVFEAKFEKLAKKAKKLGMEAPKYVFINEAKVKIDNEYHLVHTVWVDMWNAQVKVEGWQFVATIQHSEEGNILRNLTQNDLPISFRTAERQCEHCNASRNRKDTYILLHDNGEFKQVGRNCLADFLGRDALSIASRAEWMSTLIDTCNSLGTVKGVSTHDDLETYLAHVAEYISLFQWTSRTKSREYGFAATADQAWSEMHPAKGATRTYEKPTSESFEIARKAIDWAASIPGDDIEEYLHNIRIIAKRELVQFRESGLAASIVAAYKRHLGESLKREAKAISNWVGTVGEKIESVMAVEKAVTVETQYGTSKIYVMRDEQGNDFTWFSSTNVLEAGMTVKLKATVKAHDMYKGNKTTKLTRCKVQ